MSSFPTAHTSSRPVRHRSRNRGSQDGYVLLYLLLMVAMMGIFALMVMVPIKFELKRERETEMIHRGVQYSRAIRSYYKKFGRYPTRLEDLDNTNNLRYLRKHYKDPLTGKDFKLLHYGDPGLAMSSGLGGGGITGANTVGQMNASAPGNSAFGGSGSSFGGSGSSFGGSGSSFGGSGSSFGGNSNSAFGGGSSSFGGNSNSAFGGGSSSGFGSNSNSQTTSSQPGTGSGTGAPTDPSQAVSQTPGTTSTESGSSTQQVFGGGPIVGVASISKDTTIREYNKKKKYNEWQFVYDPTTDRGGLIMTPYQPALQIAQQPLNGQQPGSNGTNGNTFGQPAGFGSSSPSSFGNPSPQQPPANPPQQQQ
jgi:hypothetical protein